MELLIIQLETMPYEEALELQQKLLYLRQQNLVPDILLLLEHNPVITIGKSGNYNNVLLPEQWLKKEGIQIQRIERGGDVTYHGPGQLVGYPILDLRNNGKSIKNYIYHLEEVFINLLQEEYNVTAGRDPDYIGVWTGNDKITAIGVAVKKWVTMHGFAFNVNTNLEHFKLINPCGIKHKGVTSLATLLGEQLRIDDVKEQVATYFYQVFQRKPYSISRKQLEEIIGWDGDAQKKARMVKKTITGGA